MKIKLLEEFSARKEKIIQSSQQTQGVFFTKTSGGRNQRFQRKNDLQKNTRNKTIYSNNSDGLRKTYKCNFCKKVGHKATDCWKKAEKQKENKQSASKAEENAFFATVTSRLEEKASTTIALNIEEKSNN